MADTPGEHTGTTTASAWVAVLLMVVGFALCVAALPIRDARIPLLVAGIVLGLAGIVLGKVVGIMSQGE